MFRSSESSIRISVFAIGVLLIAAVPVQSQQTYSNPVANRGIDPAANGIDVQGPSNQFGVQSAPANSPFAPPIQSVQANQLAPPIAVASQPGFQGQPAAQPFNQMSLSVPQPAPVVSDVASQKGVPEPNGTDSNNDGGGKDDPGDKLGDGVTKLADLVTAALSGDRESQKTLAWQVLPGIFVIIAVMFAANWIGNYLRNLVTRVVSQRVDVTLGRFAGKLAKFAVMMIALMGILSAFKIELTSLAALVAAVGFAIGMALQGTLGSFAAGIALLVFRPFKVGDFIVVDGVQGTVQAIELFTTAIDTPDHRRIIIPNESVFGNRIENWTHNECRRVDVAVGVAYSADMKQSRQVLLDAIADINGALPSPAPVAYLCELGASSVDWSCRVWCRPEDFLAVKERVTESVKISLDRNGIGIPFPQLDLHVVSPTTQQQKRAA